ncbi:MAG: phosphatidate cytidylyltransferase [Chitinivibrionales bacterium]
MNISNLKTRILFALWAAPVGWWFVNSELNLVDFLGTGTTLYPGQVLAAALILCGAYEYCRMLGKKYSINGFHLSYIYLLYQFTGHFWKEIALTKSLDTYALLIIVAVEATVWGRHSSSRWKRASLLFSGTAFLSLAGLSLLNFYSDSFRILVNPATNHPMTSQTGIIIVLLSIFLCDTAAFIAGSLIGKHHFSSVSPKKTIEGSAAGLVTAVLISITGFLLFGNREHLGPYLIPVGLTIGLVIGFAGQAGDLLVSLMKRYFNVKDSSSLIPGHGGILDRFDSLFFTAPALQLVLFITSSFIH